MGQCSQALLSYGFVISEAQAKKLWPWLQTQKWSSEKDDDDGDDTEGRAAPKRRKVEKSEFDQDSFCESVQLAAQSKESLGDFAARGVFQEEKSLPEDILITLMGFYEDGESSPKKEDQENTPEKEDEDEQEKPPVEFELENWGAELGCTLTTPVDLPKDEDFARIQRATEKLIEILKLKDFGIEVKHGWRLNLVCG